MFFKIFNLIIILLSFIITSCSEGGITINRPPGLIIASENAVENGKKQLSKGHCKQAIHEFNKAINKNPANFEAIYWLGVAEGMCGYYNQAYDRLNIAIKYAPNDLWRSRVYATIGITLLYMDRDNDAYFYFEKAKKLDPKNDVVYYYYEPNKKGKIKPKYKDGYNLVLRWLD